MLVRTSTVIAAVVIALLFAVACRGADEGDGGGIFDRAQPTAQGEELQQEADQDAEAEYCRRLEPFTEGVAIPDVLQPTQAEREEVSSRLAALENIQPPPRYGEFHRLLVEAYTILDKALKPDAGLGATFLASTASLKFSILALEKPSGGPC